jgi:NAD(P)-dependent dehydrogenase (short-subunit alcohol dehydrogenase family)
MNAALAMVEAAAPKDEIEGALAVQMACTHAAAMAVLARLEAAFASEQRVATFGSAAARLMRAYAAQVEVLRRLRNGGQQFVRVEHVYVSDCGQAVIGNVKTEWRVVPFAWSPRLARAEKWSCHATMSSPPVGLIRQYGRRTQAVRADVRDVAMLRTLADQVEQQFGKIDIVVAALRTSASWLSANGKPKLARPELFRLLADAHDEQLSQKSPSGRPRLRENDPRHGMPALTNLSR